MQRLDAKQREDSIRNENLNRESLFVRMKIAADQTNAEREKAQIEATLQMRRETAEANQKREQDLLKNEGWCGRIHEKAGTTFYGARTKETKKWSWKHIRAITAQQKLREIASQELQERIQLERELARQQQKNVLLQKQNEIEKLEAQADKMLFQQKFENFVAAKET